jgi:signal transduction histidine kinase
VTPRTAWATPPGGWRARLPGRSLKQRLVLLFLLLTVLVAAVFVTGAQRAFSLGWRDAARPLVADYVDRLAADIIGPGGGPPSPERARALTGQLPLTVHIDGPVVRWHSHPEQARHDDERARHDPGQLDDQPDWGPLLERRSADGHRVTFGLNRAAFERRPRFFGGALLTLLGLTLGAYLLVRRMLRPLDDIAAGAQRFGAGDFGQPIPVRHPQRPDELGQLARTVNTMGDDIRRMLEGQRALLLAISHELRSPLTRARLHAELLPEVGDTAEQREALLRDLHEMATLIADLLESERLAGRQATLQREPTDLAALAREVIAELGLRHASAADTRLQAPPGLPPAPVDRARMKLLLRNLLDNALRHAGGAALPPQLELAASPDGGWTLRMRDHGPGVPEDRLSRLAQAFYRPDSARTRDAGGVGLGLYLCRLVAEAHGGRFEVANAGPGLAVTVTLPPVLAG